MGKRRAQQSNESIGNPPSSLAGSSSDSSLRETRRYQSNLRIFESGIRESGREPRSSHRKEKENSTDRSSSLPPPSSLSTPARKEKPNHIYFVGLMKYIRGKNVFAYVFEDTKSIIDLKTLNPKSIQAMDDHFTRTDKDLSKYKEELSAAKITALSSGRNAKGIDIVTAFGYTGFHPSQLISPNRVSQSLVCCMMQVLDQDGMAIITTKAECELPSLIEYLHYVFKRVVQKELRHLDGSKEYLFLAFRGQKAAVGERKSKDGRTHKTKNNVLETRRGASEI
jgi:hypothetical protein